MESSASYPRLFTIEEANGLLPALRPLIENILENLRRLKGKSESVIRNQQLDPEAPDLMKRLRQDQEIARLVGQIKGWVEEIHAHGCVCKGIEQGLIDFPCLLGADVVFLCWQYGEASVSYWHGIEEGFAGRRTLLDTGETDPDGNTSVH